MGLLGSRLSSGGRYRKRKSQIGPKVHKKRLQRKENNRNKQAEKKKKKDKMIIHTETGRSEIRKNYSGNISGMQDFL
jgi:hypothetical protein